MRMKWLACLSMLAGMEGTFPAAQSAPIMPIEAHPSGLPTYGATAATVIENWWNPQLGVATPTTPARPFS